jgi:hemoglobin/transferrin/lactoferrin receptor protein
MSRALVRQLVARMVVMVLSVSSYALTVAGQTQDAPAKAEPPATTAEKKTPDTTTPVTEKITVTATRFERLIDLTPQSVTVMDAKEIHARPLWNVQAILDDAPGISLQRAGALDGQIVVRGLSSNDSRIVLFIDGDRFRGRNFLEYSLLDPNEIERIEIIRGPAAALYGSDAMNGVVNVITRRAVGDATTQHFSLTPQLYAAGFSSANHMGAGRLELQGLGDGFDMLIGANYRKGGDYESPAGKVLNSDFTTRSLTAHAGYSPDATRHFELTAKIDSVDDGRANAPGAPLVTTREDPLKEHSLRFAFSQSQVAPWLQDVDASLYARNLSSILRSVLHTAANGDVESRDTWVKGPLETGGKLLARSVFRDGVLAYGVDFYHEDAPSYEDDDRIVNAAGAITFNDPRAKRVRDASQTDAGALAHYDWDPSSRWTVSLGSRYDFVQTDISATPAPGESPELSAAFARNLSAQDTALTGSAGLIFRPLTALQFVGNVSTAFRSPTTGDKSGSGVVGALNTLPNADLKPESSVSYEGGVRVRLRALSVNVTAFRTDYKDLIQFKFLDPTTRQTINIGRSKVDGFELDGTYELTKTLACRFNAASARGTDTLTGVPLPYVPPLNGLVGLRHTWPASSSWLEGTVRWSLDKTRIDPSQERPTDGYHALSIYAGMDLGRFQPQLKSYRLTAGIDNLTNEAYVSPTTRELVGFPRTFTNPLLEPGRSLTINLTAGF